MFINFSEFLLFQTTFREVDVETEMSTMELLFGSIFKNEKYAS